MVDRASWHGHFSVAIVASSLWVIGAAQARQAFAANDGAQIEQASAPQEIPKIEHEVAKQLASDGETAPHELPANETKSLGPPPVLLKQKNDEAGDPRAAASNVLEELKQNELMRVGGALVIVFGLLFAARALVRRTAGVMGGGSRPSGVVEILARYPVVGRGQCLILLKVGRRIVLLHQSGTSMSALSEMHDPDEVANLLSRMEAGAEARSASKFRSTLEQFMNESPTTAKGGSPRRTVLPRGEAEIIDLTRRNRGLLSFLFGGIRGDAR